MIKKNKQKAVEVNYVAVYPKFVTIKVGEHLLAPHVTVLPEDATCKGVLWHSEDENIAYVHPSGKYICAKGVGNTRIFVTTEDGRNYSDCIAVVVQNKEPAYVPVSDVCISPSTRTVHLGCSTYIFATVSPRNATNRHVIWSSDDPDIATIHTETGLLYTCKAGSTVIRARAEDGSGAEGVCRLVVHPYLRKEDPYGS